MSIEMEAARCAVTVEVAADGIDEIVADAKRLIGKLEEARMIIERIEATDVEVDIRPSRQ